VRLYLFLRVAYWEERISAKENESEAKEETVYSEESPLACLYLSKVEQFI